MADIAEEPNYKSIEKGFRVEIVTHNDDGRQVLEHPERVREIIALAFEQHGISEDIDFTLNVQRELGPVPARTPQESIAFINSDHPCCLPIGDVCQITSALQAAESKLSTLEAAHRKLVEAAKKYFAAKEHFEYLKNLPHVPGRHCPPNPEKMIYAERALLSALKDAWALAAQPPTREGKEK